MNMYYSKRKIMGSDCPHSMYSTSDITIDDKRVIFIDAIFINKVRTKVPIKPFTEETYVWDILEI